MLTKDSDRMLCEIYKHYLSRVECGTPKVRAKDFGTPENWPAGLFSDWNQSDAHETLLELKRAGMIRVYLNRGFVLLDAAIVYMENRTANKISEGLDMAGKIKGAIPFL